MQGLSLASTHENPQPHISWGCGARRLCAAEPGILHALGLSPEPSATHMKLRRYEYALPMATPFTTTQGTYVCGGSSSAVSLAADLTRLEPSSPTMERQIDVSCLQGASRKQSATSSCVA